MAAAQARPESTAVATTEKQKSFAVALIEQHGNRIEAFLPPGTSLERVAAALRLEAMKNPQIAECTPASLIQSIGRITQWGLEIGVTAYLVPFKDRKKGITEAVAVMGYTGMAELMVASGAIRHVEARCVYEHDEFQYEQGLNPQLRHVPDGNPATRGALVGAYCILRIRGGDVFEFMSIEDIEAIRAQYSRQWGPDKVRTCPPWYAKKTVVRAAAKLAPKNPRLARALAVMEEDLALEAGKEDGPVATVPAPRAIEAPRGPRPLTTSGMNGYDDVPVPPAQHSDDPGASDEDYIDDSDLVD